MKNRKKISLKKKIIALLILLVLCIILYNVSDVFRQNVNNALAELGINVESENRTEQSSPVTETPDASKTPDGTESGTEDTAGAETAGGLILLSENLHIPLCSAVTGGNAPDHEIKDYGFYTICYRESYEQAEWSAYCLTAEQLVKNTSRTDDFRPDNSISTGTASLSDYKGSGYDRGHLTPAADMAFSREAMSSTFFMSNMSPQAGGLNRGIWKDLEAQVRDWVLEYGRAYIVSGPVLEKGASEYDSIGGNEVTVPEYYYKVILVPLYADENDRATPLDTENVAVIGFVFPNEKCEGTFFDYASTIDAIETRTGLDFFSALDDTIETKIESTVDVTAWE